MTWNELESILQKVDRLDWNQLFEEGKKHQKQTKQDGELNVTFDCVPAGRLLMTGAYRLGTGQIIDEKHFMAERNKSLWTTADAIEVQGMLTVTHYNQHTSDYRDAAAAYGEDYYSYDIHYKLFSFIAKADGTLGPVCWYGTQEWCNLKHEIALIRHARQEDKENTRWIEEEEMLKKLEGKHIEITVKDRKSQQELQHVRVEAHKEVELTLERGTFCVDRFFVSTSGIFTLGWNWISDEWDQIPMRTCQLGKTSALEPYIFKETDVVVTFTED